MPLIKNPNRRIRKVRLLPEEGQAPQTGPSKPYTREQRQWFTADYVRSGVARVANCKRCKRDFMFRGRWRYYCGDCLKLENADACHDYWHHKRKQKNRPRRADFPI